MAGGVSADYLLLIFSGIERPMSTDEIRKIRGAEVDSFAIAPMVKSGVHYGLVQEVKGKFFPTEALLKHGIESLQKAGTLYREWLDSLNRQNEYLKGTST